MKRIGNIYNQIISIDNLVLADQKARKGKTGQYGILVHDRNREANIISIHESLRNQTYRTSAYNTMVIRDPKERLVYRLPYYPDRIVHHAIMNILEPYFVSTFTADTYSCIKGRGIHACSGAIMEAFLDVPGTLFCLKFDIVKFYPNVNHDILKILLRRKFKDPRLLWLLDEIIDSAPGVPIGNYLSQYFANFYLSYFDHCIKEVLGAVYYFRYADDMALCASNAEWLHNAFKRIQQYLSSELLLTIKSNWQVFKVASFRGDQGRSLDMGGYQHFHELKLVRKSIKKRCARRLKKKPSQPTIGAYNGWLSDGNCLHLKKKLLKNGNSNTKTTKEIQGSRHHAA